MTLTTQDKVSKKANPDSKIERPEEGYRLYKVVNNFTDGRGRRWQTDQNFESDDEHEVKLRLDKGEIRADGEPPHVILMGVGEYPPPKWEEQRELARERGELPPELPPVLRETVEREAPKVLDKERA